MYTQPTDLEDQAIFEALASLWEFHADRLEYQPVGFGSHHWLATDENGDRRFVTVDDLRTKLLSHSDTTDATYERLSRAFRVACALHHDASLGFVVAPLMNVTAQVVKRVADNYSLVVHRVVDGKQAGRHGKFESVDDSVAVLDLIV